MKKAKSVMMHNKGLQQIAKSEHNSYKKVKGTDNSRFLEIVRYLVFLQILSTTIIKQKIHFLSFFLSPLQSLRRSRHIYTVCVILHLKHSKTTKCKTLF